MTKSERRAAMPTCTQFIDEMREAFPGLTIIHAKENGHEWGEEPMQGIPLTQCITRAAAA